MQVTTTTALRPAHHRWIHAKNRLVQCQKKEDNEEATVSRGAQRENSAPCREGR